MGEGLSEAAIGRRLKAGRLHQLHRGVYLVGHAVPPHTALETAALLACGPRAVLSHRSAGALWQLLPYPATAPVWVTVPPERSATRPGIRLCRAELERRDVRRRHRLSLTSPPRAILDLAAVIDGDELERVVAEAHYRRLASEAELRQQLERNPHKRGVVSLRTVLGQPGGPRRTRSDGERALLRLLRERGIGGFETNAKIHGYEVDFGAITTSRSSSTATTPLGPRGVRARSTQGRNPQGQRDRRDADHGPPNQARPGGRDRSHPPRHIQLSVDFNSTLNDGGPEKRRRLT